MKKVILGSVLLMAVAQSAHATTQSICTGASAAANGTAVTANTSTFVKTSFTPKCSANVHLVGDDLANYYGAGAISSKGKNVFQGSTAGGGVKASGSCAATGCVSGDAVTAATTAPAS